MLPNAPRASRRFAAALLAATLACSGSSSSGGSAPPATCPLAPATTLQVTSSTPAPNQSGAAIGGSILIRFNTCIDPATVSSAVVTFTRTGLPVPASVHYDAAQASLLITPTQPLLFATTYYVGVSGLLRGAAGQAFTPYFFSFTTQSAPELIPPTTTATPRGDHYNVPQLVALACQDNPGGTGCAATHYTLDGSTPTLASPTYTAPILVDRSLTLRFFSVDAQGNQEAPKAEAYVIDTTPPGVSSFAPAADATGVRLDVAVQVVFDEPMRSVSSALTSVPAADWFGTYDAASQTATYRAADLLECGTTYTVTVAGATDLAGNALGHPVTWSFTTWSDCAEPRTAASVASGAYPAEQDVMLTCDDGAGGSGCARIVYTTDGSVPQFDAGTGTVVVGSAAGPIHVPAGETVLRFRAEDAVGHREVMRERTYSISADGFTYVVASGNLLRGAGVVPAQYFTIRSVGETTQLFRDAQSGRLYRRTRGAVAWSDDDGTTWSRLDLRNQYGTPLTNVWSAAADGSHVYVGSDQGLYVSIDGGNTFQIRHDGIYDADWMTGIALSGRNVYVATRQGMLVSHDRFRTWSRRSTAVFTKVTTCGDDVYATHGGGVDVSHDAGASWATVVTAATATQNGDVACAGGAVYVATDVGLAISTDRGDHFTALRTTANGLDANDVTAVAVAGTNVYAGTYGSATTGKSFAVSVDGGATFAARLVGEHDHDVTPSAIFVEGSTILVGAFPTLWRSADGGATFALAEVAGFAKVVGSGVDLYGVVSGAGSGFAFSHDRGRTWTYRDALALDGGNPSIYDAYDPTNVFADGTTVYVPNMFGLSISSNGGDTFVFRTRDDGSGIFSNSGECVAASGLTVWYGHSSGVQKSTNGGQTFAPSIFFNPSTGGAYPRAIALSGQNVYVAADYAGLQVSNDGGTTWSAPGVAAGIAYPSSVDEVKLGPDGKVYVTDAQQVEVSADAGKTFTAIAATAATYPTALHVTSKALYVGTGSKLGVSTDGGATFTWIDQYHGMSSVASIHFGQ